MRLKIRKLGAVSLVSVIAFTALRTPALSARTASIHAGINAVLAEYLNESSDGAKTDSEQTPAGSKADTQKKQKKKAQKETAASVNGYQNLGIANVDNYVNIRETADESARIVGKLPADAGCEILSTADGWYQIRSGEVSGYVKNTYLITGKQAAGLAKKLQKKVATVRAATVYIREKPAADCAILTMVTEGEELEVAEEKEGGSLDSEWIKIRLDEEEGYVSAKYVHVSEELKKAMAYTEITKDGLSEERYNLVQTALGYVGNRYAAQGTDPEKGLDSAGFTMQVLSEHLIYVPHSARKQAGCGTSVDTSQLLPGDLIFYGIGSTISHVGMYIGNGQIIHASGSREGVKISGMFYRTPICCRCML